MVGGGGGGTGQRPDIFKIPFLLRNVNETEVGKKLILNIYSLNQGSQTQIYRGPHPKKKMLRGPQLIGKSFYRPQLTRKV
jgi:hypothetical protein